MPKFEVNKQEYDVRLDFKAIKVLNKEYATPLEFVGEVVSGSVDAFVNCLYAGLQHTGKGFGKKLIESEVEKQIEGEQLDLSDIIRIGNEALDESFFYKKTVNNLMKKDPQMKELLKELAK